MKTTLTGDKQKNCIVQVFNFPLGCFVVTLLLSGTYTHTHPRLWLKTPQVCHVRWNQVTLTEREGPAQLTCLF
jgi:hypothetical protein